MDSVFVFLLASTSVRLEWIVKIVSDQNEPHLNRSTFLNSTTNPTS